MSLCWIYHMIISKGVSNSRNRSITAASLLMQLSDWFVTVRKFSFVIQFHHSGWCPWDIPSLFEWKSKEISPLPLGVITWISSSTVPTFPPCLFTCSIQFLLRSHWKSSLPTFFFFFKSSLVSVFHNETENFSLWYVHAGFNSGDLRRRFVSGLTIRSASRPQILRPLASASIKAIEMNLLAALSGDEEIKICEAYEKNKKSEWRINFLCSWCVE